MYLFTIAITFFAFFLSCQFSFVSGSSNVILFETVVAITELQPLLKEEHSFNTFIQLICPNSLKKWSQTDKD